MGKERQNLGAFGEKLAVEHLKKQKYKIRETNFRCSRGEIDIVAQDRDFLVFVEVRTRTGSAFGTPEESITRAKKEKLISLAFTYYQQTPKTLPSSWRIDVIAVEVNGKGDVLRLNHIENAV